MADKIVDDGLLVAYADNQLSLVQRELVDKALQESKNLQLRLNNFISSGEWLKEYFDVGHEITPDHIVNRIRMIDSQFKKERKYQLSESEEANSGIGRMGIRQFMEPLIGSMGSGIFESSHSVNLSSMSFLSETPSFDEWENGFDCLVAYKEEFGDCLVKKGFKYRGYNLGSWVANKRAIKGDLTLEQTGQLDEIEFVWDVNRFKWENGFDCLVAYKEEFGDCLVKKGFKYRGYNLGSWVANKRAIKDNLLLEQTRQLDEIEFVWDVNRFKWIEGFNCLVAYKKEFGDCQVPSGGQYNSYNLGRWVAAQRYKKRQLLPHQINRLNNLEFVW
jgi:hypothetical protein